MVKSLKRMHIDHAIRVLKCDDNATLDLKLIKGLRAQPTNTS